MPMNTAHPCPDDNRTDRTVGLRLAPPPPGSQPTQPTLANSKAPVVDAAQSPFQFAAGAPSLQRHLTHDQRLSAETHLVQTLRDYTTALAFHCQHETPAGYTDYVNDLTEPDLGNAPDVWTVRLATLLHLYADYMPTSAVVCAPGLSHHAWVPDNPTRDDIVVVDLVTTFQMTELDEHADQYAIFDATRTARRQYGDRFIGLRHIVLDAPYESTWNPVGGPAQPLHDSVIAPTGPSTGPVSGTFRSTGTRTGRTHPTDGSGFAAWGEAA